MSGSVGGVGVNEKVWIPELNELRQAPDLGALELDEITVEIEPLRILAEPHPVAGSNLSRAMLGSLLLISVHVEVRNSKDHKML